MRNLTEDDYLFVPSEDLELPPEGIIEHLKDNWWAVHPKKGLVFYNLKRRDGSRTRRWGSPQCNSNEVITRRVARNYPFEVEIKFIPSVFITVDMREYIT